MGLLADWVTDLGGMAQKQQLVALGARDRHLTAAVRSGELLRVRNGWYTTLPRNDPRVRAVRVGGRLTGVSAIEALGGWVDRGTMLHVSVPSHAARLRSPNDRRRRLSHRRRGGVALHWESPELLARGTAMTVALLDALSAATRTS